MTRIARAPVAVVLILCLVASLEGVAATAGSGDGATVGAEASKQRKKCKKGYVRKRVKRGTKCVKRKKDFNVLYGTYLAEDRLGGARIIVGKATSGPYAGKEYALLSGDASVKCSDGQIHQVHRSATAVISGKTFRGSQSEAGSSGSLSGSFTSVTTMKGVMSYSYTVNPGADNPIKCDTGAVPFTAKYD